MSEVRSGEKLCAVCGRVRLNQSVAKDRKDHLGHERAERMKDADQEGCKRRRVCGRQQCPAEVERRIYIYGGKENITMIYNERNKAKLEAMFAQANGKSRERLLTYESVGYAIAVIEKSLGIAKKDMVGITAVVDPNAQDFPNAYRYTPYSVYCRVERKASGWDVTPFGKYRTARRGHMADITLTERAKEAIIDSKTHV